jgi:formate hydrogenlyase subunit 3/multisubunit Na+/H+ antiporter MnhD subunit
MSAPIIWIVFPFLLSLVFIAIGERTRLVRGLAVSFGLLLTLLAFLQPIGGIAKVGGFSIEIRESLIVLGRAFTLQNSDRFLLSMVYLIYTLYVGLKDTISIESKFTSLGLTIIAILVAAVAVEPFLYSAILIELAVLVAIPLANQKGTSDDKGLLYFLTYLSLAMPLILLAGWILGGIQANPSDEMRLSRAAVLLGIGFALWLGVFPFHSWIPKFSSSVHPYISGFLFSVLSTVILFITVDYFYGVTWLRESSYLTEILRVVGIVMTFTGGLFFSIEKELKRMLGLVIIFETGTSLLFLSFHDPINLRMFYLALIPRLAGISLFVYCLSIIVQNSLDTDLDGLKGIMNRYPFTSIGLVLAMLSFAGFPIIGSYPFKSAVIFSLGRDHMVGLIWLFLGVVGLFIGISRSILVLSSPAGEKMQSKESFAQIFLVTSGVILLFLMGIFPESMVKIFNQLIAFIPGIS